FSIEPHRHEAGAHRFELHTAALETACSPRSTLLSIVPRPGFEPGTPRSKRGMMVHFTIGASSGRQGSRTLISVGRTAFPERPGQPYPATFHSVDPPGIEPGSPACRTGVVPLDHEPASQGSGARRASPGLQLP